MTFAVKDCSVEEVRSGAAFDVLKNGCLADLVSAQKYELGKDEGPRKYWDFKITFAIFVIHMKELVD